VKYVRKNTREVEWSYHLGDINWTEVNPEWCADHYYNLPCDQWNLKECIDWSHVNDIDFKNYSSWEAMLVSIRNFNLVIEVNYTSAREKDLAIASDIVWYYRGNLSHQHNPDYLPNGNIIIVDSNNNKFIEVNRTTKEIVWEWSHPSIEWARDCDLMPDDRYLITDIDKAMIINRTTGKILHTFPRFFGGYEADYLSETNTVLIACGSSGEIFEYSLDTGEKVWSWGSNALRQITIGNVVIFILFEITWIIIAFSIQTKMKWMIIIPMLILIGLEIYVVADFYTLLTKIFVRMING
jgi:hypothetical protein